MREEIRVKLNTSKHNQINLSDMNIQDDEVEEIAREINSLYPNVQDVFLDRNNIGDKGACILGKEFAALPKLSCIDIQFNNIDKTGVTALISLKINHPRLRLALFGNKIKNAATLLEIE